MIWRELDNFSSASVCLVLASNLYDEADYYRNYEEFLQAPKNMKVPFLDLKPVYDELRADLDAAYRRVMESGQYLLGPELEQFEAEFAAYCDAKFCIGVGNGLDALHLILKAYEIGRRRRSDCPIQHLHCHFSCGFLHGRYTRARGA